MTRSGEALDLLAHDRMMDFQELADEAFRDLPSTGGQRDLRQSLETAAAAGRKPTTHKPKAGR